MLTIEKMKSKSAALRLQGIVDCLDRRHANEDEIKELYSLKKDNVILAGRTIGMYACAVLDILGIEEYQGENETVLYFINEFK